MKRVVTDQWVAFDGVTFPIGAAGEHAAETACRTYERRLARFRLVGLTIEQVEAALTRADLDLAEAFEEVARCIKRIRLGKGAAPIEAEAAADEERERAGDGAQASEAA